MPRTVKPEGHVALPLVIFGFLSLFLGLATEILGAFGRATQALRELWGSGGLPIVSEMGLPDTVGILLTAIASFGLAGAILGTPGTGRRMILGASVLVLSLALIPAFAVWGIFWKPFGITLAVIWSWFSASIYAGTHRMPCEGEREVDAENVIRLGEGEHMVEHQSNRADGQG